MILEVATLAIKQGQTEGFERDFKTASALIASIPGYRSHELHKCIERPDQYLLMVTWENLEAHTVGFRQSAAYQEWRRLLHPYYDPMPTVEHYQKIL